jgi:hypothetical protein
MAISTVPVDRVAQDSRVRPTHALYDLALALHVLAVCVGRRQRQLPRQEIVAGVAVGHLHDLAALAQIVDVFSENDFRRLLRRVG